MSDAILFDENFSITQVNSEKYDRVSRIFASGSANDMYITLDVHTEIYPCSVGDNFSLCLASTLALDGSKDEGRSWKEVSKGESTLADHYDYVCHGKVYRFEEGEGELIKVFVSFGGLLLYIEGPYKRLTPLRIEHIYLLMRKA